MQCVGSKKAVAVVEVAEWSGVGPGAAGASAVQ
jgi:hypothetical protein